MCLILFAYRTQPDYPLIIAANRDEFHARASSQVNFWSDHPHILAGRDLVAGGTWLGCTRSGRFAGLTNFNHPSDGQAARSRGLLVQEFLTGSQSASHYAHHLDHQAYAGFNLLLFDGEDMLYTSNRGTTDVLAPGVYGLSNAELGAQWPKCVQGAALLESALNDQAPPETLVSLLANQSVPDDKDLPHRGREIEFERRVAPRFIVGDEYGTRASSVLFLGEQHIQFTEQQYHAAGVTGGKVSYQFARET